RCLFHVRFRPGWINSFSGFRARPPGIKRDVSLVRTNERITLFLQARSSSSRLPLKALLSIGGMPLSLLVARRAMNRGRPLLLATSAEASDDALAALFSGAGIPVYRGSLDDPLKRFAEAARGLRDEDWIVRLTGDNPLPDG